MEGQKADETLWSRVPGCIRQVVDAAPDLLEAAILAQKTFIELLCEYECDRAGPGSYCENCPVSKTLAVLDKAIRRAKGEEADGPFAKEAGADQ